MKLKNILLVVDDIDRSIEFYHNLFGLDTAVRFEGNVILTEGLVLQERKIWDNLIGKRSVRGDGDAELYFEENNLDHFLEKLEHYPKPVRYLTPLTEYEWGKRVVRIYDPDGHIIEVGEVNDLKSGKTM